MLSIIQIEQQLKTVYPDKASADTQLKRQQNITAFRDYIDIAKTRNVLSYEGSEERLYLYSTQADEKVIIQFPGKESAARDIRSRRPYDFRPKIILPDGTMIRDMTFSDMWTLVENLDIDHHGMLKCLAAQFFRMGRMISHQNVTETYEYKVIDCSNDTVTSSGTTQFTWNKLIIDDDVLEALNYNIPAVTIDPGITISFEAFLYFFDLILQNEDIKYNDKKHDLSSGRIPTSDSMLLLTSYFLRSTTLSDLLQRYVSGFGVAKCLSTEIEPATGGLVRVVNRKKEILALFNEHGIVYRSNAAITVRGNRITASIKTATPKIAILKEPNATSEALLTSAGWMVFDFTTALDDTYFHSILSQYGL